MITSLKGFKNTSEFIDFRNSENRVLASNIFLKIIYQNSIILRLMVLELIITQLQKERLLR